MSRKIDFTLQIPIVLFQNKNSIAEKENLIVLLQIDLNVKNEKIASAENNS